MSAVKVGVVVVGGLLAVFAASAGAVWLLFWLQGRTGSGGKR